MLPAADLEVLPRAGIALGTPLRRRPALSREAAAALVPALEALGALAALGAAGLVGGVPQAIAVLAGVAGASLALGRSRAARLAVGEGFLEELPRLHHVAAAATLLLLLAASLAGDPPPGASAVAGSWLAVLAGCTAGHHVGARLRRSVVPVERCLVLGSHERRESFAGCLRTAGRPSMEIVAGADLTELGRGDDARPTIEDLIARHRAGRVVVLDGTDPARTAQAARRARNAGARVSLAQEASESVGPPEHVEQLGCTILLSHSPTALDRRTMAGKRTLDVTGAVAGLVVLAPVLLVISLAIRLTSRGPVLFWQERIGLGGRRFRIAKFRTMVDDAEDRKDALRVYNEAGGGLFKIAEDPRVTPVGRVLRRTSLDELPQLINVLRGEMSLVGPRPLVTEEDALVVGWHRDRLALKPGMTGRWQVLGSARIALPEMIRLDQQYVASWSLALDLRILLRTALFVVRRRGL